MTSSISSPARASGIYRPGHLLEWHGTLALAIGSQAIPHARGGARFQLTRAVGGGIGGGPTLEIKIMTLSCYDEASCVWRVVQGSL